MRRSTGGTGVVVVAATASHNFIFVDRQVVGKARATARRGRRRRGAAAAGNCVAVEIRAGEGAVAAQSARRVR